MYLITALNKIAEMHGENTFAIVYFKPSPTGQRLDLARAIYARERYEYLDHGNHNIPMKRSYRLSKPTVLADFTEYTIYSVNESTGEVSIDATVTVYPGREYKNRDWEKTFHETKYPTGGLPWWLRRS